ncbi:MAG: anti-sigma factor [candidate division Zixibacteria bacterium]|nr:anti-sigma factor [candidate division Zixibacteria bacterium]MCI0594984.1 anti-sigma factor [candidate division Zixibacteria bacterium]
MMDCLEARKRVQLYLDSELETEISFEIEKHLESCTECAAMFKAEQIFHRRASELLSKGERTDFLWETVESKLMPGRLRVGLKSFWFIAPAALVIFLAILWFRPKTRTMELTAAAEESHQAYVYRIIGPDFHGPVPEKIARELDGKLDTAAFYCQPSAAGFKSRGKRVCHIGDVPAAVVLGDYQGVPVSVMVLKRDVLERFPETKRRLGSGESVVCSRAGNYQLAVRVVGQHLVCVIGELSKESVEELAKSINNRT